MVGIIGILFSFIPFGGIVGLVAFVLGLVAPRKGETRNGLAVAGIVTGLTAAVISSVVVVFLLVSYSTKSAESRTTTDENGAQARLTEASLDAEAIYTTQYEYPAAMAAPQTPGQCATATGKLYLACVDPSLTWVTSALSATVPSAGGKDVHVSVGPAGRPAASQNQVVTFTTRSQSGRIWCTKIVSDDGYGTAVGTYFGGGGTDVRECAPMAVTRSQF